jgi:uncharacterized protein HemY
MISINAFVSIINYFYSLNDNNPITISLTTLLIIIAILMVMLFIVTHFTKKR